MIVSQAPTHFLVIPKVRGNLAGLSGAQPSDEATLGRLLLVAGQVARQEGLDRGYRVVVNDGECVPYIECSRLCQTIHFTMPHFCFLVGALTPSVNAVHAGTDVSLSSICICMCWAEGSSNGHQARTNASHCCCDNVKRPLRWSLQIARHDYISTAATRNGCYVVAATPVAWAVYWGKPSAAAVMHRAPRPNSCSDRGKAARTQFNHCSGINAAHPIISSRRGSKRVLSRNFALPWWVESIVPSALVHLSICSRGRYGGRFQILVVSAPTPSRRRKLLRYGTL